MRATTVGRSPVAEAMGYIRQLRTPQVMAAGLHLSRNWTTSTPPRNTASAMSGCASMAS
jgi:hypothetical protein